MNAKYECTFNSRWLHKYSKQSRHHTCVGILCVSTHHNLHLCTASNHELCLHCQGQRLHRMGQNKWHTYFDETSCLWSPTSLLPNLIFLVFVPELSASLRFLLTVPFFFTFSCAAFCLSARFIALSSLFLFPVHLPLHLLLFPLLSLSIFHCLLFFLRSFSSMRQASILVKTLASPTALVFLQPTRVCLGMFKISARTDRFLKVDRGAFGVDLEWGLATDWLWLEEAPRVNGEQQEEEPGAAQRELLCKWKPKP